MARVFCEGANCYSCVNDCCLRNSHNTNTLFLTHAHTSTHTFLVASHRSKSTSPQLAAERAEPAASGRAVLVVLLHLKPLRATESIEIGRACRWLLCDCGLPFVPAVLSVLLTYSVATRQAFFFAAKRSSPPPAASPRLPPARFWALPPTYNCGVERTAPRAPRALGSTRTCSNRSFSRTGNGISSAAWTTQAP